MTTLLLCAGCGNEVDNLEIVPLPETEVDSLDFANRDTYQPPVEFAAPAGSVWKTWKTLYKTCLKTQWSNRSVYLGPSNLLGNGTLIGKNGALEAQFSTKLGIPADTIAKCTAYGGFVPCNITSEITTTVDGLLQGQFTIPQLADSLQAELNAAISSGTRTEAKIKSKRENTLDPLLYRNVLRQYMNTPLVKEFREELATGKFRVITKEYEIEGFSATVTFNRAISAGLKAALTNSQKAVVHGNIALNLRATQTQTLEISSDSRCLVFVELGKLVLPK